MNTTSASLLHRIRFDQDHQAWSRFVAIYTPLIYRWAQRLGIPQAELADLVQEVFVVILKKLPEFEYDPEQSFRAWLCTVTRNAGRDYLRRAALQRATNQERQAASPMAAQSADDAEVFAEQEYRQYLSARALMLMKADFQATTWQAFWALVVEQRAAAEVAESLQITPNAVYLAKARVLSRLREELEGLNS